MGTPAHERLAEQFSTVGSDGNETSKAADLQDNIGRIEKELRRLLTENTTAPSIDPRDYVRRIAGRLVEHGRQLGRCEQSRIARDNQRGRISHLLDRATAQMAHVEAKDATLEQWRDSRRLLFSALLEWRDENLGIGETPPLSQHAEQWLEQLLRLFDRAHETPQRRARRELAGYARLAASWLWAQADRVEPR